MLYLCSYIFMYMVIFNDEDYYAVKIGVESTLLCLFWADTFMRKYVKSFDKFGKRMTAPFFNIRTIVFLVMTIDLILFIVLFDGD